MKKRSNILSKIPADKIVLIAAIIVIFTVFNLFNSNFMSVTNVINILVASSLTGLIAIGHTYLIIAGQNDLSAGSLVAFAGVLAAMLVGMGYPFLIAILVTLVFTAIFGVANAFMVNKIKIEPFIATFVTQSVVRGFAYIICGGKPVAISNKAFLWLGKYRILMIPLSVWITALLLIVFGFILSKTKFGRSVYAIGGNEDAARLAGLNPEKIKTTIYVIMGY